MHPNNITSVGLYSYSVYFKEKLQNELLQLVSRRCHISTVTENLSDFNMMWPHLLTLDDMLKLQQDVVSSYLIGRPRIQNISSIHIPFAFRASKSTSEAHPLKYVLVQILFGFIDIHSLIINCFVSQQLCSRSQSGWKASSTNSQGRNMKYEEY